MRWREAIPWFVAYSAPSSLKGSWHTSDPIGQEYRAPRGGFKNSINIRVTGAECSSVSCLRCTARGLFEPLLADMSPARFHSTSPRLRQTEYAIGCSSHKHVEAICVGTRRGWSRRGATTHAKPGRRRYWPPTTVIVTSRLHAWYVRPATTKWGSRSSGLLVSSAHLVG